MIMLLGQEPVPKGLKRPHIDPHKRVCKRIGGPMVAATAFYLFKLR